MNAVQAIVLVFGLLAIAVDVVAIVAVIRSATLRLKPLWIVGCLFGFIGLGVDWSRPDDIFLEIGIQIPIVQVAMLLPPRGIVVKVLFPLVGTAALAVCRKADAR